MQAVIHLGSVLVALAIAVGILFSFTLLGRSVRSALPNMDWSASVATLWDAFIGTAAGAFVVTLLGMAGLFNPLAFAGVLAAGLLLNVSNREALSAPWRALRDTAASLCEQRLLGLVLVIPAVIVIVPTAAPEIFYDALYYHLGLPSQYLIAGEIRWLPGVVHSAFPAYLDVLFGVCLGLGGVAVAKFFNLLFFLLGCCATAAFVHEVFGDRRVALVGAVTVGLIPGVVIMSTMCGIDTALIGFAAMSGVAIGRMQRAEPHELSRLALFAAVGAGVVAGSKYTGIWLVGALALSILASQGPRIATGLVMRFMGVAVLIAAPWYMRNLMVIGDPIYPAFHAFLGDGDASWAIERLRRDVPASGLSWASLHDLVVGLAENPGRFGAGAETGLLLPLGLVALLAGALQDRRLRPWAVAVAGYCAVWLSQASVVRYLYPVFPFCVLGVSWVVHRLLERGRRPALVTAALIVLALAPLSKSVRVLDALYSGSDIAGLLAGTLSKDEYLAKRLAYYPAAQWINAHAPSDARIYYLGETRLLYLDRPVSMTSAYDHHEIGRLPAPDAPPFFSQLRSRGITHVVINGREIARLRASYDYLSLPVDAEGRLRAALSECRIVFGKSGVQVCELPQ